MTCSVADCEQPARKRGLCNKHYIRFRKYGDVNAYQINAPYKKPCAVEGCSGRPHARGLCSKHYDQNREKFARTLCAITDYDGHCGQPAKSRGLCNKHLMRVRTRGDVQYKRPVEEWPRGEANPNWVGDDASYETVHNRMGAASRYACSQCGVPAVDWAYDHTDPNEKVGSKGYPYSTDPSHYSPMCRKCHFNIDLRRSRV